MLIDTHAHLTDKHYTNIDEIISELTNNNIGKVFCVGCDLESINKTIKLAEKYNNIYAIIGIHPQNISELTEKTIELLNNLASHPKVVAIGEIGIDLHYTKDNFKQQIKGFETQLEIANKHNLPFVIHTRDAITETISVLKKNKHLINNSGVVHCFSDSLENYKEIEKLNLKVSVGGIITFKNATELVGVIKEIPLNNILLETDSPYLTPMPFRGREINQPKYVNYTAMKLAEIKNKTLDEIKTTTTKNTLDVFKKANN